MISINTTNKKTGFSLIELLIVIAILGILASIAIPLFLGQQKKAVFSEAKSNLESLRLLEEQYFAENGCYYRENGACTNKNFNSVAAIQAFLPGFTPGMEANLYYTYELRVEGNPPATQFREIATGKATTIAKGSVFSINWRNEKSW